MKYFELKFKLTPYKEEFADILTALTTEAGLESFVTSPEGICGYAQVQSFNSQMLDQILNTFPVPDVNITYTLSEAEDKNWNEEWEKTGFTPVVIANKICIHDEYHNDASGYLFDIKINPKQAFGTGSHQTTGMILERLLYMDLKGKKVLDAGCGTGILGIFCIQKGAQKVFGYDIDNWSVRNTKENMHLNGISQIEVVEGNASVLSQQGTFDLILANINRNILLDDMPSFVQAMHAGSNLIISGFYTEDIDILCQKACLLGLTYIDRTVKENWASLLFTFQ